MIRRSSWVVLLLAGALMYYWLGDTTIGSYVLLALGQFLLGFFKVVLAIKCLALGWVEKGTALGWLGGALIVIALSTGKHGYPPLAIGHLMLALPMVYLVLRVAGNYLGSNNPQHPVQVKGNPG